MNPTNLPLDTQRHLTALSKLRGRPDLTAEQEHELERAESRYGVRWWMTDRELRWLGRCAELVAFHAKSGRWPSTTSKYDTEAKLGKWLSAQRHHCTSDHQAHLDVALPGWFVARNFTKPTDWKRRADEFAEFYDQHGRLPSTWADHPAEKRTGGWVSKQRIAAAGGQNTSAFTMERREYLDARVPSWNTPMPSGVKRRKELLALGLAPLSKVPRSVKAVGHESSAAKGLRRA